LRQQAGRARVASREPFGRRLLVSAESRAEVPRAAWLNGVNHVGITVHDLDDALGFYRTAFGLEPVLVDEVSGPPVGEMFQVPGAHFRVAFLPVGNTVWELVEYTSPVGERTRPNHNDIGGMHACLEVADIVQAMRQLSEAGVEVPDDPLEIPAGPLAGAKLVYVRDPNGVQLEVLELPNR
jgi:catechol 2,3-dioxygenase-like lactoylglutathione lyase family enzyme